MTGNIINSKLIAVIRSSESLLFLENVQLSLFEKPSGEKENQCWEELYQNKRGSSNNSGVLKEIVEHFNAVKSVNDYDALLLARVIFLLYKTVPCYDGACTLPDITDTLFDAPKPSATPRHTRGFKGTKDRRPAGKSAGVLDITKVLMDHKNLDRLLKKLWPYREETIEILAGWNCKISTLPSLLREQQPPKFFQMKIKYKNIPDNEKVLVSKLFNEEIMPILLGETWETVRKAIRIYYALKLENNDQLRAIICRLLCLCDDKEGTLSWVNDIAHVTPEKIVPTLVFIIEKGLYKYEFDDGKISLITLIDQEVPAEFFPAWAYTVIESLERGHSPECMSEYIKLSLEFFDFGSFIRHHSLNNKSIFCGGCDASIIIPIVNALPEDYNKGLSALELWGNCGNLYGLRDILKQAPSLDYSDKPFAVYIDLFLYPHHWHDSEYDIDEKWESFKNVLPKIQEQIKTVDPEYLDKWYDIFTDCIDLYKDTADRTFDHSLSIALKLSREPFLKDSECANAISKFLDISDAVLMDRFLSIPDDNFLVLDKACKRKNNGCVISWGLSVIAELEPEFTFEAFQKSPKKLIKSMKIIGPMSWENRVKVVKSFQEHLAFSADYDDLLTRPGQLVKFIFDQDISEQFNPVPRALKDFFDGTKKLSNLQVDRHLTKLKENLTSFKLQALEECGTLFLKGNFNAPIGDSNIKHAIKLYHSLDKDESKKYFKRFLDNYFRDGNTLYRDTHPLTLKWLQDHSMLSVNLWTQGLANFQESDITITLEQDPLEVLKMGTYVGSCLGLGGIWTESAVAILLDINKQVIYARNTSGSVIARQVLAISDDNKLVVFEVYPLSISKIVKQLFSEYNKKFAQALSLPLFQCSEDDNNSDYEISLILAKNWWDDGAWGDILVASDI